MENSDNLKDLETAVKGDIFLIKVKENAASKNEPVSYPAIFHHTDYSKSRIGHEFLYGPGHISIMYYEGEGHQRLLEAKKTVYKLRKAEL